MNIAPDYVWSKAFSPPDRRSIEAWAAENVTLPPVLTKRGKFDTSESRHFIAPLQALRCARVRGVRILKPVRGGGTLIADVAVPWAIENDNASVLWVFQDDKIAESHAELRQMPILESVPGIAAMMPSNRHHKRKADIVFANGLPLTLQGPALGGLQSRGFKWVICDEPWLYKPNVLANAKARMGDFQKNASNKFLAISQGGEDDGEWDFECREGVLFEWRVPCANPACGKMIEPKWNVARSDRTYAGMMYDGEKGPDGMYDKDAAAATARFVCPHCDHVHPNTERTKSDWNLGGDYFNAKTGERWDPANPPTECTFHWNAIIDFPWFELVKMWLSAQEAKHVGNFSPLVTFYQKRMAEMRSERTIHDAELPFVRQKMEMTDKAAKAWPDETARFLTADRQSEDTYWVMVRAWSKLGESRRLWFGKLFSEVDIEAKRVEYAVQPDCVVIDSGYRPKGDHGVYSACIRYQWIAAKGTDEAFFWHNELAPDGKSMVRVQKPWAPLTWGDPMEGTTEEGRTRCMLFRFSSPTMSDRVMGLIDHGMWVEPEADDVDELEREYRRQMSAEFKRPRVDKFTGRKIMVWVCPSGNNHAFDCAKMQVLCAMQTGNMPAGIELSNTNQNEQPANS